MGQASRAVDAGHPEKPTVGRRLTFAVVAAAASYLVMITLRPLNARAAIAFSDLTQLAAALFAGISCLKAHRRVAGPSSLGWLLIGAGALAWSAGQAVWSSYEIVVHWLVPFPSPADVGFVLAQLL